MRNYGVGNTKAISAWNAGATGAGILVGVIDTGIDFENDDLAGRISPLSTDVVVGRGTPQQTSNHGTNVAGIIAAGFNDYGTIGVAYESTIVSIRSDISTCTDPDDTVCFTSSDLVRAIDYAIANNVRVVNMSLGGDSPLGAAFERALLRGVEAGLVFAIAAGNEAGASPEWPGRYASDPRYLGSIIVVGAHDRNETIATFSNRAGVSSGSFVSAPGVRVLTGCDGQFCSAVNGTSFSSPAVAGALALLLDAFPNLTGREAIQILLTTARDAGDPGIDAIFGRGLLDIERAFQPVGSTSVQTISGAGVSVSRDQISYSGRAFGDAFRTTSSLQTVGRDAYRRLFNIDLGAAYSPAPESETPRMAEAPRAQAKVEVDTLFGGRLALTSGATVDPGGRDLSSSSTVLTPWLEDRRREDMMVEFSNGPAVVAYWQGRNGARSPFDLGAGDGFAALTQADRAWLGALRLGALTLKADSGVGDRRMPLRQVEEDVSRYARFSADWQATPAAAFTFAAGGLDERMGPLGAYAPIGSGLELPSSTSFASAAGHFDLGRGLRLDAEFGWARTSAEGRFLHLSEQAISSNWSLRLTSFCGELGLGCRSLTWSISQPLRAESGTFSAFLPDVPLAYFDDATFSERRFSATPSGRQIDLGLGSVHRLADGSYLNLRAVVTRDDRHVAGAPAAYLLSGAWRTTF